MRPGFSMGPRLDLRQSQSLVMTPQLQQAIKLLQLSNLDLTDYVEQEVERNPLLEVADPASEPEPKTPDVALDEALAAGQSGGEDLPSPASEMDANFEASLEPDGPTDGERPDALRNDLMWREGGSSGAASLDVIEQTASAPETLASHLQEQLGLAFTDEGDRLIGANLIDMIDDGGYFRGDIGEVAERLNVQETRVERVLLEIQAFDPAGVGARSVEECLRLQLLSAGKLTPVLEICLQNLDLLAKRDFARLARLCKADTEGLTRLIEAIRGCDPKPGSRFANDPVGTVVPDVLVREGADGAWVVELNQETLPRVLVNRDYYAVVSRSAKDAETKTYLSDCLAEANWLAKSLDQRAKTIVKVASEIVEQQEAFLRHGVAHLRPLNLKTVADAISMHESTVSRVTSHKYMSTPRGVFELKYFFTSAIAGTSGDSHSAEAVRHRIKDLIEHEQPDAVLSDDRIVEILNEQGIDIARRTVAKYREALGVSSSVQRRREKRACAV